MYKRVVNIIVKIVFHYISADSAENYKCLTQGYIISTCIFVFSSILKVNRDKERKKSAKYLLSQKYTSFWITSRNRAYISASVQINHIEFSTIVLEKVKWIYFYFQNWTNSDGNRKFPRKSF